MIKKITLIFILLWAHHSVSLAQGGTINPANITVCSGSNSGTLTLSGHTGNVQYWEYSTNGGANWVNIANTTTTQNYNNLLLPSPPNNILYRASVKNGILPAVNSSTTTITVNPATVAGNIAGSATVCATANTGTLTLSGHTGSVMKWTYSTDGGSTWTSIANTTTSQNYLNLGTTTIYHAVVKSGVCNADSASATITVNPTTVAGTIAGTTTVCATANTGTLTLGANTGTVVKWTYSNDGGNTWINIANTTTSQTYLNLSTTTIYHAIVKSGVCNADSASATITVDPSTVAGTVAGTATVCASANTGTLTLSGHTGSVVKWTYSTDGGNTWTNIANTTPNQTYTNLTDTTIYHVFVKSGPCSMDSASATITVTPPSVGGSVTGSDTVCSGSNTGTLSLSGHHGNIVQWQSTTDGGNTWFSIANTTTTLTYQNISSTTAYRAVIKSGPCVQATSSTATITVTPSPLGGILSGIATVCGTSNGGTLTLNNQSGTIMQWESSTDGGNNWSIIPNTTTTHSYLNLTTTTIFRVLMQTGNCTAYSSQATITVSPPTIGGNINTSATVCSGANSATLTLTGQVGGVVQWEYSTDGGSNWTPITNTTSNQNYTNLTTSTVYRALVQSGGCPQSYSSMATITVDKVSVGGILSSSSTVCKGLNKDTIELHHFTGNVVKWEYSTDAGINWLLIPNTDSTHIYQNLTVATLYRSIVKSGVCFSDTSSVVAISIAPLPVADAGADDTISLGYSVALNASGGVNYAWTPASSLNDPAVQSPVASPTASTTYTVTVTDANGCTDMDDVTVEVLEDHKFLITNLITPNGDGKNDTWYIGNINEYPACEVTVFNIHNTKIFSAMPYTNNWDGTLNGKELPDGTYYYILKCPDSVKESKGYITLLRNK